MRITLYNNDMRYLPMARAGFRKAGLYLTVRHGSIYTIAARPQRKSNTAAQLTCRALFREAVRCVSDDMRQPGRKAYWADIARREGYANSYTAARSHYLRKLKAEAETAAATDPTLRQSAQLAIPARRTNPLIPQPAKAASHTSSIGEPTKRQKRQPSSHTAGKKAARRNASYADRLAAALLLLLGDTITADKVPKT